MTDHKILQMSEPFNRLLQLWEKRADLKDQINQTNDELGALALKRDGLSEERMATDDDLAAARIEWEDILCEHDWRHVNHTKTHSAAIYECGICKVLRIRKNDD